jgi:hypothetical protein
MPVIKNKSYADFGVEDDYEIIDISSNINDLQLSNNINSTLKWNLRRLEDFGFVNEKNNKSEFSIFYHHCDELGNIYVIKPLTVSASFLEVYYLIVQGPLRDHSKARLAHSIAEVKGVHASQFIDLKALGNKAKKNSSLETITILLYHMELHLLELYKKEKQLKKTSETPSIRIYENQNNSNFRTCFLNSGNHKATDFSRR